MYVRKNDLTSSVVWLISVYFPQYINKKFKKKNSRVELEQENQLT